jgi:mRNA interferase RelE/StbE
MADYSLTFARSARKELEALPNPFVIKIFEKIEALCKMPRPSRCRKLQGSSDLWRIRIGDYRVVYSIDDSKQRIDVVAVRHRSQAYD